MKKILSFILVATMMFATGLPMFTASAEKNCIIGDSDWDGIVDAADALDALQTACELRPKQCIWEPEGHNRSYRPSDAILDVNYDGHLNAVDALWILQYAVGVRTEFTRTQVYIPEGFVW